MYPFQRDQSEKQSGKSFQPISPLLLVNEFDAVEKRPCAPG